MIDNSYYPTYRSGNSTVTTSGVSDANWFGTTTITISANLSFYTGPGMGSFEPLSDKQRKAQERAEKLRRHKLHCHALMAVMAKTPAPSPAPPPPPRAHKRTAGASSRMTARAWP